MEDLRQLLKRKLHLKERVSYNVFPRKDQPWPQIKSNRAFDETVRRKCFPQRSKNELNRPENIFINVQQKDNFEKREISLRHNKKRVVSFSSKFNPLRQYKRHVRFITNDKNEETHRSKSLDPHLVGDAKVFVIERSRSPQSRFHGSSNQRHTSARVSSKSPPRKMDPQGSRSRSRSLRSSSVQQESGKIRRNKRNTKLYSTTSQSKSPSKFNLGYTTVEQNKNFQRPLSASDIQNKPSQLKFLNPRIHQSTEFVSTDNSENADNNDPNWNELKRLKGVLEFKRYANSIFDFQKSNPNICQSHHGFRKSQSGVSDYNMNHEKKRKRVSEMHPPPMKRQKIAEVDPNVHEFNAAIPDDKMVGSVDKGNSDESHATLKAENILDKNQNWIDFDKYTEEIQGAISKHKLVPNFGSSFTKLLAERNCGFTLRHFQEAMKETKSIYESMCCDGINVKNERSKLSIVTKEVKKVKDLEIVYGQFVKFYGSNEEVKCKWCSSLDKTDVWHPY